MGHPARSRTPASSPKNPAPGPPQPPQLPGRTRWLEVKDYSARSRSELKLGGKVGQLIYGEEATRFFPILRAGEILHLGKNPASGCGRIRVDA
ncbi:MAG: CRISPR system precrRNA processing endoribonuclease RAMP protein Cas6 [bacterium]|nr:CRISPR system precrRNA processing endoribonuclease RAMP protein Cas6 [bacterium]